MLYGRAPDDPCRQIAAEGEAEQLIRDHEGPGPRIEPIPPARSAVPVGAASIKSGFVANSSANEQTDSVTRPAITASTLRIMQLNCDSPFRRRLLYQRFNFNCSVQR